MVKRPFTLQILALLVTVVVMAGVIWTLGWLFRGDVTGAGIAQYTDEQLDAAVTARDVSFTPSKTYYIYDDPWAAAGKPFPKPAGQSPILADLERQGAIKPLAERLPEEPYVSVGCEKGAWPDGRSKAIGEYGGTWLRVATSPGDVSIITWRMAGAKLARWSPLGYPVKPFIARSIHPVEGTGKRQWLVALRKGMKWSDGHPFTSADIMFWWDAIVMDESVSGIPPDWMLVGGKPGRIEWVKDTDGVDADENGNEKYQVRFVFPLPQGMFMEHMAMRSHGIVNVPKHYLEQWHPTRGDEAKCTRAMAAYKLNSRRALFTHMRSWKNPYHPRHWAWIPREYKASPPHGFVRNPYYFAVDTEGNQLPYVDRVQFDIQPKDTLAVTAINGMVSMQTRHIQYKHYTDYMSRRAESGTRILHWYPATRSVYALNPCHIRYVDPEDPATAHKAALLADKRFRQALSLAINRDRIIDAEYNGQVEAAGP